MNKVIRYGLVFPAIIYFGVLGILFVTQKDLVYMPNDTPFEQCDLFEESEQKTHNSTRFYEQKGSSDKVIVFFHGNAGRACGRSYMKSLLEQTQHSIIFVEYFGYADDSNNPSKKKILKDVENIGDYIANNTNYKQTYVLGRSVGTGPASYYAKLFPTEKLLLISPYSSLYKIGADQYPFFPIKHVFSENYSPEEYLKNYQNKLLIIHGDQDRVVPLKYGQELYDNIQANNKQIQVITGVGHNDIFENQKAVNGLIEFMK